MPSIDVRGGITALRQAAMHPNSDEIAATAASTLFSLAAARFEVCSRVYFFVFFCGFSVQLTAVAFWFRHNQKEADGTIEHLKKSLKLKLFKMHVYDFRINSDS